MNEGDRVVHHSDSHKVKCRFRAHGTVTKIDTHKIQNTAVEFAEVRWSDGQVGRHVLANLRKCSC